MTVRSFLSALVLILAVGVTVPIAMAQPPGERVESDRTPEVVSDVPSGLVEPHDDAGTPPHEHGEAGSPDNLGRTAHGHDVSAAVTDHHGSELEARATDGHHAGEDAGVTADHHGIGAETGGHAHWGEDGPQTGLDRAIARTGALHTVAVHFPIALILAAVLAQALGLITGQATYSAIVRFLVWTAAFGGLAAGILGWAHAGPIASTEVGIMSYHRWLGTTLTIGLFITAGAAEWKHRSGRPVAVLVLTVLLFGAAIGVAVNGFLGGSLAHGGLAHLMGS